MKLKVLDGEYSIVKLNNNFKNRDFVINLQHYEGGFFSITYTEDEISVVIEERKLDLFKSTEIDKLNTNYVNIKVDEVLDFSLVGILYKITEILKTLKISVFVISTYNTDYIMIEKKNLERAVESLRNNGYEI
ncbi:MAG: ACT domain-containing protein [Leptotrichiaceae bacterium]|jgi:hypothetical protein|nr:ACT domain-containing protein [Leptotrichiaceae bacterium]MBP6167527.1 ACT domain-containing protein [Leptotrichiaceae bacterium]MBP7026174.1 ACT domain-containing protein [Leptotrichiaceae bacterium]MBP8636693.1 ACT domain-containing protein [Leptotrichiaceae bacterium]MBP9538501.1 ACT domain-containing protein [Leptotrichiaceae bacterium]